MKHCIACNEQLEDGAKFCSSCRAEQPERQVESATAGQAEKPTGEGAAPEKSEASVAATVPPFAESFLQEIREAAHAIWLRRECPEGQDNEIWLEAEQESIEKRRNMMIGRVSSGSIGAGYGINHISSFKGAINAFHVNWTKPFFYRNQNQPYCIEDYDLLATLLSALEWRKHNGGIKMITDETGSEYYRALGLEHIWNMGIDACLDALFGALPGTLADALTEEAIAPMPFWAAGKIVALRQQPVPCVMLDTDFIVWKSLADDIRGAELSVIHREGLSSGVYPEKSFFHMEKDYQFPSEWNWTVLPCNTALLHINNENLKDYYTSEAIRFMRNLVKSKDITAEMVFAEQRLLAMCADAKGINIKALLDMNKLNAQTSFTHAWGFKRVLESDRKKRRAFCLNCIARIANDFPEEIAVLQKIESLKQYFADRGETA